MWFKSKCSSKHDVMFNIVNLEDLVHSFVKDPGGYEINFEFEGVCVGCGAVVRKSTASSLVSTKDALIVARSLAAHVRNLQDSVRSLQNCIKEQHGREEN